MDNDKGNITKCEIQNQRYSPMQMCLTIEAIKRYPWDSNLISNIEVEEGPEICIHCEQLEEITVYITLKNELQKRRIPKDESCEDKMEICWRRMLDGKTGESYWSMNSDDQHESYRDTIWKKINEISDKVTKFRIDNILDEVG